VGTVRAAVFTACATVASCGTHCTCSSSLLQCTRHLQQHLHVFTQCVCLCAAAHSVRSSGKQRGTQHERVVCVQQYTAVVHTVGASSSGKPAFHAGVCLCARAHSSAAQSMCTASASSSAHSACSNSIQSMCQHPRLSGSGLNWLQCLQLGHKPARQCPSLAKGS
jgi:hypothetical protein